MWSFLMELVRSRKERLTLIAMDPEGLEQPRQHHVRPGRMIALMLGAVIVAALVAFSIALFTPVHQWLPGANAAELQRQARTAHLRIAVLEDSLHMQRSYMAHLRSVMLGEAAASAPGVDPAASDDEVVSGELARVAADPPVPDWDEHAPPARPPSRIAFAEVRSEPERYVAGMTLPVLPPVEGGLATRGFDARSGHYALDLAVEEGTTVHAIGDGHVIMADWTHEGGYAIAVQHADGYVSVYKHNERLLKRLGERVTAREPIAMSGNSGEVTTGPHLHFELWRHGLAQDPTAYLVPM